MITKDKIEEAENEFIGHAPDVDEGVETLRCREGFRGGVEWFKKAIWHDVSELPERYDTYLAITEQGCIDFIFYDNLGWYETGIGQVEKWCDFKDIVPNE